MTEPDSLEAALAEALGGSRDPLAEDIRKAIANGDQKARAQAGLDAVIAAAEGEPIALNSEALTHKLESHLN